ncbi:2TM domain-containing protein [Flavobacterium sp. NKUCC04_CG]|uniref:2TM domain-containing protein n=1 Tax=Flavobacterium sp. NKUCC04_CG TaxID=2842121 RepID=UPI002103BD31|nr:2TM domain-containing protein [Flavobacterium sp. NKUCC04_CG]
MKKFDKNYSIGIIGFTVVSFIVVVAGVQLNVESHWLDVLRQLNKWMIYILFLFFVNRAAFLQIEKRYDVHIANNRSYYHLSLYLAWLVAALSFYVVPYFYQSLEFLLIVQLPWNQWVFQDPFSNYLYCLIFFPILIYLGYYIYFNRRKQSLLLQKEKVISGNVSAQFESLKNQLDPHFLFNSLNVLSALIEENPNQAQEFTQSLSKIYRYILDQKNKDLISIEEEVDFARTYMVLLQMRFEDSVTFDFPTEIKNKEARVLPLALQLLLENVIKHNKTSSLHPIHIAIVEEQDYLIIENNLQKKQVYDNRKGIGLQNIADRYALLTSRQVIIDESEEKFTVKLPILIKKNYTMELINENDELLFIKAKKRVEAIKKFYSHLTSYLAVNTFLMVINLYTEPAFLWFLFPLFGWGIGILSHGMRAYNYSLFLGSNWEDKKLQEILEEEKRRSTKWD